jgi:hypothetical protein
MPWEKLKQLPENIFAGIHAYRPRVVREGYHHSKFKDDHDQPEGVGACGLNRKISIVSNPP